MKKLPIESTLSLFSGLFQKRFSPKKTFIFPVGHITKLPIHIFGDIPFFFVSGTCHIFSPEFLPI